MISKSNHEKNLLYGLQHQGVFGGINIDAKNVKIADNRILVYFEPRNLDRVVILTEIVAIMGFVYGYLGEEGNTWGLGIRVVGAQAEKGGKKIMYVVSEWPAVKAAAEGLPISWIKGSLIEDFTDEHWVKRLAFKKFVFENSMRTFIKQALEGKFGDTWWRNGVPKNIKKKCEERKRRDRKQQFDRIPSFGMLYYADFPDYKKIINANWDGVFALLIKDKDLFNKKYAVLEPIRIDEAHSKTLDERSVKTFEKISDEIINMIDRRFRVCLEKKIVKSFEGDKIIERLVKIADVSDQKNKRFERRILEEI